MTKFFSHFKNILVYDQKKPDSNFEITL